MERPRQYKPLTPRAVVELAAPHTWPASILPAALGTALSLTRGQPLRPGVLLSTLFAAVLLQCAVNTLNDYADFVKGTDTLENSDDSTDAALVYHGFNPRCALILGGVFLLLAAACGVYTVVVAGWIPLVIGIIGGIVVLLYSMGRLPISYLPLGEFFSGVVMGGGITLACFTAQSGIFDWKVLWYALPCILTIGLIMLGNNTSDVERDRAAGRHTLAVLLGRRRSALLLKALLVIAMALTAHMVFWNFRGGFFLLPVMVIAAALQLWSFFPSPVDPSVRGQTMRVVVNCHKVINSCYVFMIATHLLREVV